MTGFEMHSRRLFGLLHCMVLGCMAWSALAGTTEQAVGMPVTAVQLSAGTAAVIDGRLDEPFWAQAQPLDAFYETEPGDRLPPRELTEVRFAADARYLYIAVRAWDANPAQLRAPLARRDDVGDDVDKVTIWIDPSGTRRSAQFFDVSASGVLGDGWYTEVSGSEDRAPDFRFRAATGRFDGGWTAELAIPFSSLRYAAQGQRPWTVLVGRNLPRSQSVYLMSAPVAHDVSCFLCFSSILRGVQGPADPWLLQGTATLAWRRRSDDFQTAGPVRGEGFDAALDVKLRLGADTDVDATWRPDFSQVEIDAPQLSGNVRRALDLAEKRPFFQEGADILQTPLPVLRTRSLAQPRWGLRVTHRSETYDGALVVVRDAPGSELLLPGPVGADRPVRDRDSSVVLARVRYHHGTFTLGSVFSERRHEGQFGSNQVAGLDASWSPDPGSRLDAQWLSSQSSAGQKDRDVPARGQAWQLHALHRSATVEAEASLRRTDAGFRADNGFFDRADLDELALSLSPYLKLPGLVQEIGLDATVREERAASLGERLFVERTLGFYAKLPKLTRFWVYPWTQRRERSEPGLTLHDTRQWAVEIEMTPAGVVSGAKAEFRSGRTLDLQSDRVGPGLAHQAWIKLQPLPMLQLQLGSERQRVGGGIGFDERSQRLLMLWHLGSQSYVRWIDQRRRLLRSESEPQSERASTLSLQSRHAGGWVFDAGMATRRSAASDGSNRVREFFVKANVEFER